VERFNPPIFWAPQLTSSRATGRSYIPETSFIKNINLNASIETFISIKSGNGYTWQFGPQFRKQLLSTNNNQYTVEERLNNYGLKFGVSKTF